MKFSYSLFVFFTCFFLFVLNKNVLSQDISSYVQPLSGTASSTTISATKHAGAGSEQKANTIPSVGLPFGMTQWVAETRQGENKCIPPYYFTDNILMGFRGTHWISGSCMQDYGSFTIIPVTGRLKTDAVSYGIPFSHDREITTPYYYSVETKNIKTEITSTLRCAVIRFTMLADDSLHLLIRPNSDYGKGYVKMDSVSGEVWGGNPAHRIYQGWGQEAGFDGCFYFRMSRKMIKGGTFIGGSIFTGFSISKQKDIGVYVSFYLKKGEQIEVFEGTSFSNAGEAKKNLAAEIGKKDFADVRRSAKAIWDHSLSQIGITSADERTKQIFYTALYHAMQLPRLYNDVDGTYPMFSHNYQFARLNKGNYYDDFSMWDIYRAQLPLFEILQPAMINDFIESLIIKGQQGSWLPIFPCWNNYTSEMIGDHVTAFIASAYTKGIRNYNITEAYRLMRKNAFESPDNSDYVNGMGRRALPSYLKFGYIPMEDSVPIAFHKKEQVSRTLEYAYDDYALAIVAKGLQKTGDYKMLYKRAFNYKNVFYQPSGIVRGRYEDGRWSENFNPDKREKYITEGTPRQYTFYVPQDVTGLAKLMGGRSSLEKQLDSLFIKEEYWHGNEPGHQIPFMYNFTASPWKTQKAVRDILSGEYNNGPGGLSGNDDAGQISAWYVFASMGLYPVDPVSGNYIICSPLFDAARIKLPNGKSFEIICHKKSEKDIYIDGVQLNGKAYSLNYISHSNIVNGGRLEIWLKSEPGSWGSKVNMQPKGLSE